MKYGTVIKYGSPFCFIISCKLLKMIRFYGSPDRFWTLNVVKRGTCCRPSLCLSVTLGSHDYIVQYIEIHFTLYDRWMSRVYRRQVSQV